MSLNLLNFAQTYSSKYFACISLFAVTEKGNYVQEEMILDPGEKMRLHWKK